MGSSEPAVRMKVTRFEINISKTMAKGLSLAELAYHKLSPA